MMRPVTTDGAKTWLDVMKLYDANALFEGGTKAMKGSRFKQSTQLFEMNQLLITARLQSELMDGTYKPDDGNKFIIRERGKTRYITSNSMRDKTVNHVICYEYLTPAIMKYLIYDNGASQKGKGVGFHRKRLYAHLRRYYARHGSNDGYILLSDFTGYYPNIPHDKCMDVLDHFLRMKCEDDADAVMDVIRKVFKTFEVDVSRFSDEEIERMTCEKVEAMLNCGVEKRLLTGKRMLRKGVDIGNQISQDIGIVYPYRVDNYVKIVCGIKEYARYSDDTYAISDSKEQLLEVLEGVRRIAAEYGILINKRKTRICRLRDWFRFMQIAYRLNADGSVPQKIHPQAVTRERRKLKAYKRLYDANAISYEEIENAFKGWIGGNYKRMSNIQIANMGRLYYDLFGKEVTWKKGHGRLRWLMAQRLRGLD